MTSPAFNVYFDPAYDVYSVLLDDFMLPDWWDFYLPDNQDDYACRTVIAPNQAAGATKWTHLGKFITIGIYRDQGRPDTNFPTRFGLVWQRIGNQIVINDPDGHTFKTGDLVNLANVNLPVINETVITNVYSSTQFAAKCGNVGATSGGSGSYQPVRLKSFYEENIVFRMLPDFRLLPYSVVLDFFSESMPAQDYSTRYLTNITNNQVVQVPRTRNENVDYTSLAQKLNEIFRTSADPDLRFNQAFDEEGEELAVNYDEAGRPIRIQNVNSKYSNSQIGYNSPRTRELPLPDESEDADDYVYCYDFYGFEINDVLRGPFFANDLITRDPDVEGVKNNLLRKSQNGAALYNGYVNDIFGNIVIGVQENNATVVRKPIMPLALDIFNRPIKQPYTRVRSV